MIAKALILSLAALCLVAGTVRSEEKEEFATRLKIDHKAYIDEALQYILKERPTMKPENLAFSHMSYHFQMMEPTTQVCGPEGCKIVPAAPFQETLTVSFTVLDTKSISTTAEGTFQQYETLNVQFPTPRMPEWYLLTGTSTARISGPEK
jgi:hypothetical protein